MSLDITPATEIKTNQATYLIYGRAGVGKTTSLQYLPGKTLVIDVDKSSSVLKGAEDIDILKLDTSNIWEEWNETVSDLVTNSTYEEEYDNIVIDNVSELFRSCLENLGKLGRNDGVPSMADYQKGDFMIMRAIRALKNLDVRLVITAWETVTEFTDESGQTMSQHVPDIRRTILNNLLGLCDVVGRLSIRVSEDGEVVRGFVLQPTSEIEAKNRLDDRRGCLVDELFESEV